MSVLDLASKETPVPDGAAFSTVLSELWISFVSLTRSHLGALQTTGRIPQVKVLETSPNSFIAGDLNGNIAIMLNIASGLGAYETKSCGGPAERGSWRLNADGSASVGNGEDEDMELAVEFFARKLMADRSEGATL